MKKILYLLLAIATLSACTGEIKEITEKYSDGSPKVVTYFKKKNDIKIKVREIGYYQSQKEMYKGVFENGVRAGKWIYWYETGKLFAETEITESVATQSWQILQPDGKPYKDKPYRPIVLGIYQNGSPYQVNYIKPTESLIHEFFFYPSYKLQMIGVTLDNKREGKWYCWFENGNVQSEGFYKNGENDSIRTVYYENGQKYYEGKYNYGKEVSKWKFYDKKGKLAKEVDYDTVGIKNKGKK